MASIITVKKQRGLTLIEMLVALVILSGVIVLSSQAYSQYIAGSQTFYDKYRVKLGLLQRDELIRERLRSARLYIANTSTLMGLKRVAPYQVGKSDSWAGVTYPSLQQSQYPAIFKLHMSGERLFYCEKVIDDWLPNATQVPKDICEFSVLVRDDVESLKFRYFGWENYMAWVDYRQSPLTGIDTSTLKQTWHEKYLGYETKMMPEWVEVTFELKTGEKEVWLLETQNQDPSLMYNAYSNEGEVY